MAKKSKISQENHTFGPHGTTPNVTPYEEEPYKLDVDQAEIIKYDLEYMADEEDFETYIDQIIQETETGPNAPAIPKHLKNKVYTQANFVIGQQLWLNTPARFFKELFSKDLRLIILAVSLFYFFLISLLSINILLSPRLHVLNNTETLNQDIRLLINSGTPQTEKQIIALDSPP